jgi:regulator of protease activity HflC (stomatin/prohibitin superfamily)
MRRMANVLDAVLETTKALSPAPVKKIVQAEAKSQAEVETGQAEAEAAQSQAEAEAGPSVPIETEPVVSEEKSA